MSETHAVTTRNTSAEFVGVEGVKTRQRQQLELFEQWAASGDWAQFHKNHYDWWMFPIDRDSGGQGATWTVYADDVTDLKHDPDFVRRYTRGVKLLMQSWGWELYTETLVPHPSPSQTWQGWPVRLFKAARSLKLFGYDSEFASLRAYAQMLMSQGESMSYGGHDLSWLFTTGIDPEQPHQR